MCNSDIHNYFLKINHQSSYCLYCDKYLKQPQYKIIKCKDVCIDCNSNDFIVDNNAMYCKICGG